MAIQETQRKNGKKSYLVSVRVPDGKRHTQTVRGTRAEAEMAEAEMAELLTSADNISDSGKPALPRFGLFVLVPR